MSKKPTKSFNPEEIVVVVYLIQGNQRFLLNFFPEYGPARSYVKALSHFKINGELLIGEVALKYLVEGGAKNA